MSEKLKITLTCSLIGRTQRQRRTVQTLGLKKINDSIVREDTPAVRGMINKISHIVTVEQN